MKRKVDLATVMPYVGDMFQSRNGKSLMRVERIKEGRVECVHITPRRQSAFSLPLWFFSSPACGWKLA